MLRWHLSLCFWAQLLLLSSRWPFLKNSMKELCNIKLWEVIICGKIFFSNSMIIESLEKAQRILLMFVIACYPNSLSDEFATKFLLIHLWMILSDSVRHIFIVRLNSMQHQIYSKFVERIKELVYWCRAIEQRQTIDNKKTELLDMADINIVEAKIPYPTEKVGFRLNCTILPYYCYVRTLSLCSLSKYWLVVEDDSGDIRKSSGKTILFTCNSEQCCLVVDSKSDYKLDSI